MRKPMKPWRRAWHGVATHLMMTPSDQAGRSRYTVLCLPAGILGIAYQVVLPNQSLSPASDPCFWAFGWLFS